MENSALLPKMKLSDIQTDMTIT